MTQRFDPELDPVRLPDDVRRRLESRMVDALERTRLRLASSESTATRRFYESMRKAALGVIRGVPLR